MASYELKKHIAEQVGYLMLGYDDVESFNEDYETSIMVSSAPTNIENSIKFKNKNSTPECGFYFSAMKNGDIFAVKYPEVGFIGIKNQRHILKLIDIEYKHYSNVMIKVDSMSHEEMLESLREGFRNKEFEFK